MDDYFAAQALIIERLKARVAGVREVRAAGDSPREMGRVAPLIYVAFHGEREDADAAARVRGGQLVTQAWRVELVVRSTRDPREDGGPRENAGPLLAAVNRALLGWKPGAGFTPLTKGDTPAAVIQDGIGIYPQVFLTRVPVRGDVE